MHRIDTATAQKDKFGAGKNGFTRGNPQTGTPATDLDDDYFDMLQEELVGVVEASGVTPDKEKRDQLLTALKKLLLSRSNPFGDIKADGAAAIATALANLGLGGMRYVTARGGNANGGWTRWSDGSIEVYGSTGIPTGGLATVTYPISLPAVSYNISIADRLAADAATNVLHGTMVIDSTLTASGFKARSQFTDGSPSTFAFSWRVFYAVV